MKIELERNQIMLIQDVLNVFADLAKVGTATDYRL